MPLLHAPALRGDVSRMRCAAMMIFVLKRVALGATIGWLLGSVLNRLPPLVASVLVLAIVIAMLVWVVREHRKWKRLEREYKRRNDEQLRRLARMWEVGKP